VTRAATSLGGSGNRFTGSRTRFSAKQVETTGMTQQQPLNSPQTQDSDGVPPPPRFLFWLVVTLFILLIIGGVGGLILLQNRPAPSQSAALSQQSLSDGVCHVDSYCGWGLGWRSFG
jgi:hypothetical protein